MWSNVSSRYIIWPHCLSGFIKIKPACPRVCMAALEARTSKSKISRVSGNIKNCNWRKVIRLNEYLIYRLIATCKLSNCKGQVQ